MATTFALKTSAVYFVGVPSAGKTSLIAATLDRMKQQQPSWQINVVSEAAREVIAEQDVGREDIRAGTPIAMEMQYQILKRQLAKEIEAPTADFTLLDRSGIDPIAFSKMYGGNEHLQTLLQSTEWMQLRIRMRQALVIVCEPVEAWLEDDELRLLPKATGEWQSLHDAFCKLLEGEDVSFVVLPKTVTDMEERVQFVLGQILQEA